MAKKGERIVRTAFEILKANPEGLRFSELVRRIEESDSSLNTNTINGYVWDIHERYPDKVYKPSRGLFRLTEYRDPQTDQLKEELVPKQAKKAKRGGFLCRIRRLAGERG